MVDQVPRDDDGEWLEHGLDVEFDRDDSPIGHRVTTLHARLVDALTAR